MKTHTKLFKDLEDCFKGIEHNSQSHDTTLGSLAFRFWLDLEEINTTFYQVGRLLLLDEEMPIVQDWTKKVINNSNVPVTIRKDILTSSVDFDAMVNSVERSHISTLNM